MERLTKSQILANKKEVLRMKRNTIKRFISGSPTLTLHGKTKASKSYRDNDTEDKVTREIVGNTYLYMDSHDDVHVPGIFTKSIQENKNRIPHLHDHVQQLTAKVGTITEIEERIVSWKDLAVDFEGTTVALVATTDVKRQLNDKVFDMYKADEVDQHSVGMQYVKLELATNDPNDTETYKVWSELIDKIANREEVEKQGYFFAVREAKLFEISAVLMGSNPITHTLSEPSNLDTLNLEPPTVALKSRTF